MLKALLAIMILSTSLSSDIATEVEDKSSLTILNPDFAERKTAKMRLQNGFELLLISDPKSTLSAAAVVVEAGSWNDPPEFPGMAHFCEHMLFMGTAAYPDPGEFMKSVVDFGGTTNAMTASDRTAYLFSSNSEGFPLLLDRFSHFFIDPLFDPSCVSREMHAVDQEFAKSLENDGWRSIMVLKETGNPEHPNRLFSCGNSKTLSLIPQGALKAWHQKYYSADRMHAVLYSPLPLDTLKTLAVEHFKDVAVASPPSSVDSTLPMTSLEQKGHLIYIKPIREKQELLLLWELPPSLSNDPTLSSDLVAYALNRGQKNSLYEVLKKEALIENLSITVDDMNGKDHHLFMISLDLTEEGMKKVNEVISRIFQAIHLIQSTGVPHFLFQEKNQLAQIKYQYQSRQDPFSYCLKLALALPDESLETFPKEQLLASSYSPQKISEAASFLVPEECLFLSLSSPDLTQAKTDRVEKWFGAEYTIRPISSEWLNTWKSLTLHPDIKLPTPNPFIANHLALVESDLKEQAPTLISQNEFGCAYFSRCPEFKDPKASVVLHILSPELTNSSKSQVLGAIYARHFADLMHSTLLEAAEAGLSTSFDTGSCRLTLTLCGFSEKVPLLLQDILSSKSLSSPTREKFDLYVTSLQKIYANADKDLPFYQAKDLIDSLMNQDKTTSKEKLAALKTIDYEEFLSFQKKLFEKTYVEAFFAGNFTLKEAESMWLDVIHVLSKNPFPKKEHPKTKVVEFPDGPFSISQTTPAQGNAALLAIDEGPFSHQKRAAQEILSLALKEAFFNELRTKQKTGYMAVSEDREIEERLFQFFSVESNSHEPEDLLYRFELFLEEFLEDFQNKVPKERFVNLQEAAVNRLKNRVCNLCDKSALLDLLAFHYRADFQFLEKRMNAIYTLSYEDFCTSAKEFLARANKKRLAILYKGKLSSSFVYETTTPKELSEIATYTSKPETLQENR